MRASVDDDPVVVHVDEDDKMNSGLESTLASWPLSNTSSPCSEAAEASCRRNMPSVSVYMGDVTRGNGNGSLPESMRIGVLVDRVSYTVKEKKSAIQASSDRSRIQQSVAALEPDATPRDTSITLLDSISALFSPGQVSALMGPSGAGKTTLLDILAGRKRGVGEVSGRIFIGQVPVTRDLLKSVAAYVEQNDTLLGTLTVRETLLYQAELKGDPDESTVQRVGYVDSLIKDLKLSSCKDVTVGDVLNRRISGGQSKRTSIGISLVTRPRILFLDEPTSGLDSQTSIDVMMVMRGLANCGVNVVATIHSPTTEAFRNFDDLLLLSNGKATYCGPLFGSLGAARYFEKLGFIYDPKENLADHLISTVSSQAMNFAESFDKSEHAKANSRKVSEAVHDILMQRYEVESEQPFGAGGAGGLGRTPTLIKQFSSQLRSGGAGRKKFGGFIELRKRGGTIRAVSILLRYRTLNNYRSAKFVAQRAVGPILLSMVLTSMYSKQGGKPQDIANQLNIASLFFMNCILPSYAAAGQMPSIVLERPLFYREQDDGCYPVISYVVYKLIEEGIIAFPVSLIAQSIIYFGVGLQGSFIRFWIVNFLISQTGIALAYSCSSVAKTMDQANALLPIYNTLQLLFSGLLIRRVNIPSGWKWWTHTLFVRYGWQAQLTNHFGRDQQSKVFKDEGTGVMMGITEYYGANLHDWKTNVGCIFALWIMWLLIAGYSLSTVRHQNR